MRGYLHSYSSIIHHSNTMEVKKSLCILDPLVKRVKRLFDCNLVERFIICLSHMCYRYIYTVIQVYPEGLLNVVLLYVASCIFFQILYINITLTIVFTNEFNE